MQKIGIFQSFETRPGPAGRLGTQLIRGRNRAGLMKKQGKEKPGVTHRVDPADLSRPDDKPVDFCFFFLLKRRHFDFFFKN
jgi:hypothetical protein